MKNMKIKTILTLAALALLLTFAVGGTLAYLIAGTDEVENVFTPAQVDTEIKETIENNAKTSITVENVQNDKNIPAYVRVAVVGNWCDASGNIVEPWDGEFSYNMTDWTKEGDYYYYKRVLAVGAETENLLAEGETISGTSTDPSKEGLHLEVTVIQQAVQSEPNNAVKDAWGFVPGSAAAN